MSACTNCGTFLTLLVAELETAKLALTFGFYAMQIVDSSNLFAFSHIHHCNALQIGLSAFWLLDMQIVSLPALALPDC